MGTRMPGASRRMIEMVGAETTDTTRDVEAFVDHRRSLLTIVVLR